MGSMFTVISRPTAPGRARHEVAGSASSASLHGRPLRPCRQSRSSGRPARTGRVESPVPGPRFAGATLALGNPRCTTNAQVIASRRNCEHASEGVEPATSEENRPTRYVAACGSQRDHRSPSRPGICLARRPTAPGTRLYRPVFRRDRRSVTWNRTRWMATDRLSFRSHFIDELAELEPNRAGLAIVRAMEFASRTSARRP